MYRSYATFYVSTGTASLCQILHYGFHKIYFQNIYIYLEFYSNARKIYYKIYFINKCVWKIEYIKIKSCIKTSDRHLFQIVIYIKLKFTLFLGKWKQKSIHFSKLFNENRNLCQEERIPMKPRCKICAI